MLIFAQLNILVNMFAFKMSLKKYNVWLNLTQMSSNSSKSGPNSNQI